MDISARSGRMVRPLSILFGLMILIFSESAAPIEVSFLNPRSGGLPTVIRLSGTIEKGDHKILLRLLTPGSPTVFFAMSNVYELDSPGGDVYEAMLMADILKDLYPTVVVSGTCASSCLLLYLAGAIRLVDPSGRIGVHRPYFDRKYFASLEAKDAEKKYRDAEKSFREFVLSQGLPLSLYERLVATPGSDLYWLSSRDLSLIGWTPPYFGELMDARCGSTYDSKTGEVRNQGEMLGCVTKIRNELILSTLSEANIQARLKRAQMPLRVCLDKDGNIGACDQARK